MKKILLSLIISLSFSLNAKEYLYHDTCLLAFDSDSMDELVKQDLFSSLEAKNYSIVMEKDSCYVGLEIITKDSFNLYNNTSCERSDCNLGDVKEYLKTYKSLEDLPKCRLREDKIYNLRTAYMRDSLSHKHGLTLLSEDFNQEETKIIQSKGYRTVFSKEHMPLNGLICNKDDQGILLYEYIRCPHHLCVNPCTMIYVGKTDSIDNLPKCKAIDSDCYFVEIDN